MLMPIDFTVDTLDAIRLLHRRGRYPQLLVLLYAGIDTLGWLGTTGDWATGESFKKWVDRYMLPDSPLTCTSEDLWAARNGLLHTATAKSKLTTDGRARQIWYYGKGHSEKFLSSKIADRTNIVAVRIVDLIEAFGNGAVRFSKALESDPQLAVLVNPRVALWLRWMPSLSPDEPAA